VRTTRNPESCLLYGILDTAWLAGRDPAAVAAEMIRGGVEILQIRAKGIRHEEIREMVSPVLRVTRPARIPLIINDHPELARETEADGVHLGQDDMPVAEARRIVGSEAWIGKSTHSLEQALRAEAEGPDYMAVGPIYATPTKPDYPPVGLDLVRQVRARIRIPFFCIGGIKLENVDAVLAAGARRVVIVSGILQAPDIAGYCRHVRRLLAAKNRLAVLEAANR